MGVLVVGLLGCAILLASEEGDFRKAVKQNRVYALERFLEKFPRGQFAQEARDRIDDLIWHEVTESGSDNSRESECDAYLKRFPEGRHVTEARGLKAKFVFTRLKDLGQTASIEGWEEFVSKYGSSEYVGEARARLAELQAARDAAWKNAQVADTLEGYLAFLERYPKSPYDDTAARRIEEFERTHWELARAGDTLDAYDKFYNEFPRGHHVEETKAAIKKLLTLRVVAALGGDASRIEDSDKFPLNSFAIEDYETAFGVASETAQRQTTAAGVSQARRIQGFSIQLMTKGGVPLLLNRTFTSDRQFIEWSSFTGSTRVTRSMTPKSGSNAPSYIEETLQFVDSRTGLRIVCRQFSMQPLVTEIRAATVPGMMATIYRVSGELVAIRFAQDATEKKTIKSGLVGTGMAIVEDSGGVRAYRVENSARSFLDEDLFERAVKGSIAIEDLFTK